jgi:hypothetical protein
MNEELLREQLLHLLEGRHAHMTVEQAVADFPLEAINQAPPNVSYTPWQLLEHIRIAQWDILAFIRDPDHVSPEWPDGYWPARSQQADAQMWQNSVERVLADRKALAALVRDPESDLFAPLPAGSRYTILREILVVADHNAYHLGELGMMRQVLDAWGEDHE